MNLQTPNAQCSDAVASPFWESARQLWEKAAQDECADVRFESLAVARDNTEGVRYAQAPDGTMLAYAERGDPNGDPVFLQHGTPGSRKGPLPSSPRLYRWGIRLITYDRPGYGLSSLGDPEKGMKPIHSAAHVAAIADEIGIDKFVVVGRSGGARHALACLAGLPDRAMAGGVLVGPAPEGALCIDDVDQHAGEAAENIKAFTAMTGPERVAQYTMLAKRIRKFGGMAMLGYLASQLHPNDQRVIVNGGLAAPLIENYEEGVRCGPRGWVYDLQGADDWGFYPGDITQKVKMWHGPNDKTVSPNQAYALDAILRESILELPEAGTHFTSFTVTADLIKLVITLARSKH